MLIIGEFSETNISIFAENQCWTKEDLDQLKNKYNIIYNGDIWGFWIEKRNGNSPLIHLMEEDDGQLFWSKENDVEIDSSWIQSCIKVLEDTQKHINNHPKKYKDK